MSLDNGMSENLELDTSPKKESQEEEEEEDLFYFESDHLALKGNKDYSEVLKTIFILEAQRAEAIKDYEEVVKVQKKALEDPITFIDKLKRKEDIGVPLFQRIVEVPIIDWNKFDVKIPEEALKCLSGKTEENKNKGKSPDNIFKNKKAVDTHNKPWTSEEQKRLEELLEIYPPESVELRRFKKIAAALGNRTVKQVTSRVQKYFLKLYKAGLPIPGRIPKSAEKYKKSKLHMHQRHNHYLWKPSTFFPQLDIPVKMNDFEDVPGPSVGQNTAIEASSSTSNYLFPKSDEYQEDKVDFKIKDVREIQLDILKRVKEIKQKETSACVAVSHIGYKCDFCNEEPICGARWHCITCLTDSIDFCTDCVVAQMYSEDPHPLTHRLEPDLGEFQDSNSCSNSTTNSIYGNSKSCRTFESDSSESELSSEIDSESTSVRDSFTMNGKSNLRPSDNLHLKMEVDGTESNSEDLKDWNVLSSSASGSKMESNNDTSDSQMFTDTQSMSYEYLHSHLIFDDNK